MLYRKLFHTIKKVIDFTITSIQHQIVFVFTNSSSVQFCFMYMIRILIVIKILVGNLGKFGNNVTYCNTYICDIIVCKFPSFKSSRAFSLVFYHMILKFHKWSWRRVVAAWAKVISFLRSIFQAEFQKIEIINFKILIQFNLKVERDPSLVNYTFATSHTKSRKIRT